MIVCFSLAVGACGGPGVQQVPAAIPGAPEVVITATEMRFSPAEVTLPSDKVNLTLRNDGGLPHDLTIPALHVYMVAQPGQSISTGLHDLPKGKYMPYCGIQGHADAGMRMILTVE